MHNQHMIDVYARVLLPASRPTGRATQLKVAGRVKVYREKIITTITQQPQSGRRVACVAPPTE
jgi:hypothetical protein